MLVERKKIDNSSNSKKFYSFTVFDEDLRITMKVWIEENNIHDTTHPLTLQNENTKTKRS